MSWQDYVDKQLLASRCVSKAAIAGLDGNIWAKSADFEVSIRVLCERCTVGNLLRIRRHIGTASRKITLPLWKYMS